MNRELTKSLDALKTGNARAPELSLEVIDLMREAWVLASLKYGSPTVRSGHVLTALLADRNLSGRLRNELGRVGEDSGRAIGARPAGAHRRHGRRRRASPRPADRRRGRRRRAGTGPTDSKTPSLDQFTTNLTDLARSKKIDPVLGRDAEVRQIIDILTRRRQNNPILTGEAGVGKTAVVEGFALRIAAGDVPDALEKCHACERSIWACCKPARA